MKKVLIVDFHPIVLKGISSMLTDKGYTIYDATTPEQAIVISMHISDIDLVVCGLSLPATVDGIEFIKHIRSVMPQSLSVVFTMHCEPWTMRALENLAVDGIVMKGESPKELMLAMDSVLSGEKYYSPQFCKIRGEAMSSSAILSRKEIDIIRDIAFGSKNFEIAEKYRVCEKTIEYHRSSILHKLGVKTIDEAVRCACEMGLLH